MADAANKMTDLLDHNSAECMLEPLACESLHEYAD
jgi:hypothetical protein